jgi:hypothetical protein
MRCRSFPDRNQSAYTWRTKIEIVARFILGFTGTALLTA